ncbi:hypothetical protein [Krasilnikoviella flava]|uniref:Uncharacterized protein n=1 Tax=Krasilnikoviella flava TaxID=526729 RepID=A0A1T5LYC2_9MICO|nr:hypothetical protein [Krasilnikoviella flava]SKC80942.1 hypothetical protein SAMN04324258_4132 [Krasilnikoviella flava]
MTSPPVHHDTVTTPAGPAASTWGRRLAGAALGASAATAALLGLFVARPAIDPFREEENSLGHALLPGLPLSWLLLAVALFGAATAAVVLATGRQPWRVVAPVTVVEVLAFGILAQGSGTLSVAGYLVALAVPVLAVWAGVQVFRHRPAWRLTVLLAAVAAVVGIVVAQDAFGTWINGIAAGFARERWGLLAVLLPLATASAWAGLALMAAWRRGSLRRATVWVTRHRTLFTVVAALGPLPYALARLTWLTPWPQLATGEALPLAVRIQGLSLSSGAWLGIVLTLGLILPWGERLPRWFGRRAGQPVPPAAAIVPGGIVAVMLCGAAVPMIVMMGWTAALYFPAWFWGPALALAVWGYAGHRYGVGPVSDPGPAAPAPASRR